MPDISNIPNAMIDEHEAWHTRPGNPSAGGRAITPWPPTGGGPAAGSGAEFLNWHNGYVERFRQWVASIPAAQRPSDASIAPWTTIPTGFKMGMVGWNATLAADEARLQDMSNFGSLDELGRFLEWSLHGFLHNASAQMFGESVLLTFASPRSTYFWRLHGFIDHWRQQWLDWEAASGTLNPVPSPFASIPTNGNTVSASIGAPGEIDRFQFTIPETGSYRIRTHGSTDVVLYLAGPDNSQNLIAYDDDGAGGGNALLAGTLPAATYFVYIMHYSSAGTGAYEISVAPL
jgi:hypothetical protein